MAKQDLITHEYLLSILDYDAETGVFTWRWRDDVPYAINSQFFGKAAGGLSNNGYIWISIKYKLYYAHRLAWFYVHGVWPDRQVDHIKNPITDNRICNLRLATHSQNMKNRKIHKNNTSGYKGVTWRKDKNKWQAQIKVNGKKYRLGRFDCPKKAHEAYCEAAEKLHGEFSKAG